MPSNPASPINDTWGCVTEKGSSQARGLWQTKKPATQQPTPQTLKTYSSRFGIKQKSISAWSRNSNLVQSCLIVSGRFGGSPSEVEELQRARQWSNVIIMVLTGRWSCVMGILCSEKHHFIQRFKYSYLRSPRWISSKWKGYDIEKVCCAS